MAQWRARPRPRPGKGQCERVCSRVRMVSRISDRQPTRVGLIMVATLRAAKSRINLSGLRSRSDVNVWRSACFLQRVRECGAHDPVLPTRPAQAVKPKPATAYCSSPRSRKNSTLSCNIWRTERVGMPKLCMRERSQRVMMGCAIGSPKRETTGSGTGAESGMAG